MSIDFVLSIKELGLIMLSGLKLAHHSSVWISCVFTEDLGHRHCQASKSTVNQCVLKYIV